MGRFQSQHSPSEYIENVMDKLGIVAAATGIGGTGAVGIYGAHQLGAFGGKEAKESEDWKNLTGEMQGDREKVDEANKCLKEIFGE